jgi:hypothetical protein
LSGSAAINDAIADRIAVTFNLTASDYISYFKAVNRSQRAGANSVAFFSAVLGAIPVGLAFRFIALQWPEGREAAEIVGRSSLVAFLLGAFAMIVAGSILRRIALKKHLAATPNAFEARTAVFDATGVTLTGQASETRWRWAAISRVTRERDLVLVWIGGSSAIAIPRRSFASPAARLAAEEFIKAMLLQAASGAPARR